MPLFPDSSRFSPVTGVIRIDYEQQDTLLVSLFDGTIHVVKDPCTDPEIELGLGDAGPSFDGTGVLGSTEGIMTSYRISRLVRSVVMDAAGDASRLNDTGRISTLLSFGDPDTILWLHEYVG